MALANQRIFLRYDVPGPELWHERLVLAHARNEDHAVATPDSDVCREQLSLHLGECGQGVLGGGLPVGIRAVNPRRRRRPPLPRTCARPEKNVNCQA